MLPRGVAERSRGSRPLVRGLDRSLSVGDAHAPHVALASPEELALVSHTQRRRGWRVCAARHSLELQ